MFVCLSIVTGVDSKVLLVTTVKLRLTFSKARSQLFPCMVGRSKILLGISLVKSQHLEIKLPIMYYGWYLWLIEVCGKVFCGYEVVENSCNVCNNMQLTWHEIAV